MMLPEELLRGMTPEHQHIVNEASNLIAQWVQDGDEMERQGLLYMRRNGHFIFGLFKMVMDVTQPGGVSYRALVKEPDIPIEVLKGTVQAAILQALHLEQHIEAAHRN